MIMADSSGWVDFCNAVESIETNKPDEMLGLEEIATGDLIITEVRQGFRNDNDFITSKDTLTSLTVFEMPW